LTGELLDAVEESIDETEVDRRSLLAMLHATSKPPGLVWNPVANWQYPDVSEDVTQWDGVKCAPRKRYLTHDEKAGDLLEPLEVSVYLCIASFCGALFSVCCTHELDP
jgi:hypothetical protein